MYRYNLTDEFELPSQEKIKLRRTGSSINYLQLKSYRDQLIYIFLSSVIGMIICFFYANNTFGTTRYSAILLLLFSGIGYAIGYIIGILLTTIHSLFLRKKKLNDYPNTILSNYQNEYIITDSKALIRDYRIYEKISHYCKKNQLKSNFINIAKPDKILINLTGIWYSRDGKTTRSSFNLRKFRYISHTRYFLFLYIITPPYDQFKYFNLQKYPNSRPGIPYDLLNRQICVEFQFETAYERAEMDDLLFIEKKLPVSERLAKAGVFSDKIA